MKELDVTVRMATATTTSQAINTQSSAVNDIEQNKPLLKAKGEDGEYEDTRGLANRQVLEQQKKMLKDQDQHLDEIGGIVSNLRYENQNFNKEVTYQNKMLDKVNDDIDRNQLKMVKVDGKLKNLISQSNQCCLWCIIITEIVALVLILVLIPS